MLIENIGEHRIIPAIVPGYFRSWSTEIVAPIECDSRKVAHGIGLHHGIEKQVEVFDIIIETFDMSFFTVGQQTEGYTLTSMIIDINENPVLRRS